MLNAKYAKVLSEKMNDIGGIRGVIYRNIINAISVGKTSVTIAEEDYETLNWVLEDLVDIGYQVTRTPIYDLDGVKQENKYYYKISW
jgi:hypothetical protein